jgi:hypothetical protein
MRNGDATAIKDASEDPWQSDDCNLFVLTDKSARIVALHSTSPSFSITAAQEMVSSSVNRGETAGWWFNDRNLFQVVDDFPQDAFFLQKPFSRESLVGEVGEALENVAPARRLDQIVPV